MKSAEKVEDCGTQTDFEDSAPARKVPRLSALVEKALPKVDEPETAPVASETASSEKKVLEAAERTKVKEKRKGRHGYNLRPRLVRKNYKF
jgi:hypothetical protein